MASYTSLVLALLAFVSTAAAIGPVCGTTGKACVFGKSDCVGGTCVCKPNLVWGDPFVMCYRKAQVAAESLNDVSYTNFNNETVEFPFPCRYLLTHVQQELKDKSRDVIGTCEFKIHAFNTRERGKIVTHGFDVALTISYTGGPTVSRSARKYGLASNGVNALTNKGTNTYAPDGAWVDGHDISYEDAANGISVECYSEAENNNIVFEAAACGLRITFVPYDTELRRDQPTTAGLTVGVNCAHHPTWLSNTDVIGLAPSWQGGLTLADIKLWNLTDSQSLTDRALRGDAAQNQPMANPACSTTGDDLDTCNPTTRANAYRSCYWMLTEASFIKCASGNSLNHLELFGQCVASWCGAVDCSTVVGQLGACSHVTGVSQLTRFLNNELCP